MEKLGNDGDCQAEPDVSEHHTPPLLHNVPPLLSADAQLCLPAHECAQLQSENAKLKEEVAKLRRQQNAAHLKIKKLKHEVEILLKPGMEHLVVSDDMIHYYTGLPSRHVFNSLYRYIEPSLGNVFHKKGTSSGRPRKLSPVDEFLLVLMRIKLGAQTEDLQYRFKLCHKSSVSKIVHRWVPFLSDVLKPLLPWPSRQQVLKHMPKAFKDNPTYSSVRVILDCAEFEMEAPSSLSLNAMTYSDYKARNTVKVLFGVTPDGYISFVSHAYPGSISDNSITLKSGILNKLAAGDEIMADKGFTLSQNELQPKGIKLVVPPFKCGGRQFSAEEVETTKRIANLRIVVENCILRTRYCRLLRNRIPVSSIRLASDVVFISAVFANMRPPIR